MNRLMLSLEQILQWTDGRLFASATRGAPGQAVFHQVSTDTRTISTGDLYLALRGARFDGHDFLAEAIAAGATGLVIDEWCAAEKAAEIALFAVPALVVQDTLAALQAIANGYRHTLKAPVIGITGSVGKTTTRGMVAACLAPQLRICQTQANNNNEIGLPKTILTATPADDVVILEMGMRGRGEIEQLSRIAEPDIALITNIGLAHIERLGSQQEILHAKAEILAGLKPGGLLVLNADDKHLLDWAHLLLAQESVRLALVSLNPAAQSPWPDVPLYKALDLAIDQTTSRFTLASPAGRIPVVLPQPGRHLVSNALFGFACAAELGIDLEVAAQGAAAFTSTGNRQRLFLAGPLLIMDDSYNASPESMLAALDTLVLAARGRRLVAALGGMLELGDHAPAAHERVGEAAARCGYAHVLAMGPQAPDLKAGFDRLGTIPGQTAEVCADQPSLIACLLELLEPGDALLVKGSRGFAMERVTEAVLTQFAPAKEET